MIIDEIKICNFRQYYGEQSIKLSIDKIKNVTVIHGENGEGKTAFLNLIKWCFYGNCYLPDPNRLLNEKAEAEMNDEEYRNVYVEIKFDDNNYKYTVNRSLKYKKSGKVRLASKEFSVTSIDNLGRTNTYNNPQNTINQILPEKMESYFFFDGERIDNLSKIESSNDIKEAIKNIMGIEIIENSIIDLEKACNKLRKDFSKCAQDKLVTRYDNELDIYKIDLISEKKEKQQLSDNKKYLIIQKESIYERLRRLEGARELQRRRDELENQLKDKIDKIKKEDMELKKVYSSKGYLAFTEKLIDKLGSILEERRQKGEIPAGIKEQFVDDILTRKVCICGRSLEEGTIEHTCVQSWKKKSSNSKLEDAFIKMSSDIKIIKREREILFADLARIKSNKKQLSDEKIKIEEELDEISTKLNNKEKEDIQALEGKRKEIEDEISRTYSKINDKENKIKLLENKINDLKRKIEQAIAEEDKAKLAKNRLISAEDAKDTLMEILDITVETVREDLSERIKKVYNNFSKKGYMADLSEEFTLQIIKESDDLKRPVPMSQGERQITSLCFIGGLADLARERSEKRTQFFKGGVYPIVMDSPFGALDPEHKKNIAIGMPSLAQQVIILVTDSQWKGDVEENILDKVGKRYKLINYNPKKNKDVKYEYTIIEEV